MDGILHEKRPFLLLPSFSSSILISDVFNFRGASLGSPQGPLPSPAFSLMRQLCPEGGLGPAAPSGPWSLLHLEKLRLLPELGVAKAMRAVYSKSTSSYAICQSSLLQAVWRHHQSEGSVWLPIRTPC